MGSPHTGRRWAARSPRPTALRSLCVGTRSKSSTTIAISGELDFQGQRRARARDFVGHHGVVLVDDADADAWYERYLVHYESFWALHDDVTGALEALRPARFGIITNGHLPVQFAKVESVGLAPWLDHVIASGEVGVAKPDPRIFEVACAAFGVDPSSAAYVGDRLHTDAIGAARAGMRGVWIDRHRLATTAMLTEAEAEGVPVIDSLAELPAVLS